MLFYFFCFTHLSVLNLTRALRLLILFVSSFTHFCALLFLFFFIAVYQAMGCDTRLQLDAFKGKGALLSSSGMIGIIVQAYAVSDSVHLVEIRRGKGDILEYYKLFNELVKNRVNHLINVPSSLAAELAEAKA